MSIASHSSSLRAQLVCTKDLIRQVTDIITPAELSTVMGTAGKFPGSLELSKNKRQQLIDATADLATALTGAADIRKTNECIHKLMKAFATAAVSRVTANILTTTNDHVRTKAIDTLNSGKDSIDACFIQLRDLTSEATKNDASMTADRVQAQQLYSSDVTVVERAITEMETLESRIEQVTLEIDSRYNDKDNLGTAADTERIELSRLRSSLEDQIKHAERNMLEHFDNSARTRATDSRITTTELAIPDDLEKGKGMELSTSMDGHLLGKTAQNFAILPEIRRIPQDFNPTAGTFYRPPTKSNGYSDVDPIRRESYNVQSNNLWNLFLRKMGAARMNKLLYTSKVGVNKQEEIKCTEGDGVTAYFMMISWHVSAWRIDLQRRNTQQD